MSFRSVERGELLIERGANAVDPYERYESRNGGRVWLLREITNYRPRLAKPRHDPANARWRISEAESGDYDIETQDDANWSIVETFANELGACAGVEASEPFDP